LQVIKSMQSLKSRGYIREQFSWQWYYWYLTDAGINYLREFLHLPADIVPATLKKQPQPQRQSGRPERSEDDRPRREDRGEGGYRKRTGAGDNFNPEFRGYGRGAVQQSA
jgi:small subunit ribosomal protein S10e